jgi:plasmid stabilization system protein ParE
LEPERSVRFAPEAQLELESAATWYATRGLAAVKRFLGAIDRAIELIRMFPEAWPEMGSGNARRITVARTPYSLVYRFEQTEIVILAVPHGRRKPGYWLDRAE